MRRTLLKRQTPLSFSAKRTLTEDKWPQIKQEGTTCTSQVRCVFSCLRKTPKLSNISGNLYFMGKFIFEVLRAAGRDSYYMGTVKEPERGVLSDLAWRKGPGLQNPGVFDGTCILEDNLVRLLWLLFGLLMTIRCFFPSLIYSFLHCLLLYLCNAKVN